MVALLARETHPPVSSSSSMNALFAPPTMFLVVALLNGLGNELEEDNEVVAQGDSCRVRVCHGVGA